MSVIKALVLIFKCTAVWTESCDVTILHFKTGNISGSTFSFLYNFYNFQFWVQNIFVKIILPLPLDNSDIF